MPNSCGPRLRRRRGTTLTERDFDGVAAASFGWLCPRRLGHDDESPLLSQGFTFNRARADAGSRPKGAKGPVDRFRRRLFWPIRNLGGDVIGFGARKLFDDDNLGKT